MELIKQNPENPPLNQGQFFWVFMEPKQRVNENENWVAKTSTMVEAWQLLKGAEFDGNVNSSSTGPSIQWSMAFPPVPAPFLHRKQKKWKPKRKGEKNNQQWRSRNCGYFHNRGCGYLWWWWSKWWWVVFKVKLLTNPDKGFKTENRKRTMPPTAFHMSNSTSSTQNSFGYSSSKLLPLQNAFLFS